MTKQQAGKQQGRSNRGSTAIELGAAALIMIGIVAFGLNVCMAMIGYTLNDRACRDAARSAAQGENLPEALQRANRILTTYRKSSPFFRLADRATVSYTDFGGTPPAGVSPFVTVTTTASSDMPCPINLFGNNVFGSSMQFRKSYTFPIVRLTVPLGT